MRANVPTLLAAAIVAAAACFSSSNPVPDTRPSAKSGVGSKSARVTSGLVHTSTSTAATLGIPPGHLPPPGECRVWTPGTPPGHQRAPGPCSTLERQVPPGAWLVYRPSKDKKVVRVRVYDATEPRVRLIRVFDVVTGALLSEELP